MKNKSTLHNQVVKVGDYISFDAKIHIDKIRSKIVKAKVLMVYENCVLVDVRKIKIFDVDFTVVNHKNYTILNRKEQTDSIRPFFSS
ncbi:DUF2187 family protein [Bacillus sp. JJ664]